jgi:WD40 repeat protein
VGVTIEDTGDARAAGVPVPTTAEVTLDASRSEAPTPRRRTDEPLDLPVVHGARYKAIAEHARGGLGRVVRAQDRQLRREVAIKEMLEADDGSGSARFVREALVTARLQHPGIVPVYDAGYWPGGEPFYAMKLVRGRSLREAIDEAKDLDARLALVPAVLAATQAVAYAHSEGVIHRDLKPSNVMLGPFGETVVVDWGLAKDLDAAAEASGDGSRPDDIYTLAHDELTRVGAIVGTPGFMPPEQAAGQAVDERADVYALGAVLYAVLVGKTPQEGFEPAVLAASGAPRDLVAIVAKAMAPAPADRYAHAGTLADDLSRFLSGQLVRARDYGAVTRAARFFSRRRVPLTVAAILGLTLAVTAVISVFRIVRSRDQAQAAGAELILAQARAFVERDPTATLAWIARYPRDGANREGAVALAADAVSRGVARHVLHTPTGLPLVAGTLSPDGKRIAAVDGAALWIWDVESARVVGHVLLNRASVVAYAPPGRVLVLTDDGEIWRADGDGANLRLLGRHDGGIGAHVMDPAGHFVVTGGAEGDIRVWSLDGGPERTLPGHPGGSVRALLLTREGTLVSAGEDGAVRAWPGAAGPGQEIHPPGDAVAVLAEGAPGGFVYALGGQIWRVDDRGARLVGERESPVLVLVSTSDGAIVSGSADGAVRLWREGEKPVTLAHHPASVACLTVAQDGAIASGDDSGEVQVWRAGAASVRRGHDASIMSLHAAPDGGLLSVDRRGEMRWWAATPAAKILRVGELDAIGLVWSASGDALGMGSLDGAVRWAAGLVDGGRVLAHHDGGAYALALTRDGKSMVSSGFDGDIVVAPLDGASPRRFHHGSKIWALALAPDGKHLVSGAEDGTFREWDVASGASRELRRHEQRAQDVAYSADGARFATASVDDVVRVYGPGAEVAELRPASQGTARVMFSPDGRTLYTAGIDGTVLAFPVTGGAARTVSHQGHTIRALALSGDGKWLATGSIDGLVELTDLKTGRVRELRGHGTNARDLAFSPDGRWLASASFDGTVRLWGSANGGTFVWRGERGKIARVAFAPDGSKIAWSNEDGTVAVVPMVSQEQVPGTANLFRWITETTSAEVGTTAVLATPVAGWSPESGDGR